MSTFSPARSGNGGFSRLGDATSRRLVNSAVLGLPSWVGYVHAKQLGVSMKCPIWPEGVLPFLLYLLSGMPAGAVPVDLTVMTQNLYIGTNTDAVLASPDP